MSLVLVLVSALWGSSFVGSKICMNSGMNGFEIVFFRFVLGAIFMGVLFHKDLSHTTKSAAWAGFLIGLTMVLSYAMEMVALKVTAANKISFLAATNVVITPFMYTLVCRVPLKKTSVLAALISMVGVSFLTLQNGFGAIAVGDIIMLLTACVYAFNTVLVFMVAKGNSFLQIVFFQFLTGAVGMGLLSCIQGFSGNYTVPGMLGTVYLAVFPTTVCFVLRTYAVRYVDPTRAALIFSTESLFCALLSAILLHEMPTLGMVFGMALIMCGIFVEILAPTHDPEPNDPLSEEERKRLKTEANS